MGNTDNGSGAQWCLTAIKSSDSNRMSHGDKTNGKHRVDAEEMAQQIKVFTVLEFGSCGL